jgi:predicted nucleic acid-binding protein
VELEKLGTVLSFEDFDDEAARIAGRLTRAWLVTRKQQQPTASRQLVKFDAMIVATAVAAGADCIATTDTDIEKWVNTLDEADRIEVIDAVAPKGQLSLIQ